ncbi:hypothetical protein GALL_392850 [mine drainage metagenome]|uniref:Uncharacterized protein n=1 Tax=mine drainage metagenome TaxID=410659 RepID=A0A1J5Q5L3_9ZZZZ
MAAQGCARLHRHIAGKIRIGMLLITDHQLAARDLRGARKSTGLGLCGVKHPRPTIHAQIATTLDRAIERASGAGKMQAVAAQIDRTAAADSSHDGVGIGVADIEDAGISDLGMFKTALVMQGQRRADAEVLRQAVRRPRAQAQPRRLLGGAEETADDESRQRQQADRMAEPGLVKRARAAAVGDLHRRTEHERAQHQAERQGAVGALQLGVRAEQRHAQHHRDRDGDELGPDADRVAARDPDPPPGREAERGRRQHDAVADAEQPQQPLAPADQPGHRGERGQRDQRQRDAADERAGAPLTGRRDPARTGPDDTRHAHSDFQVCCSCPHSCAERDGTCSIGSCARDQPTIDSG